MFFKNEITSLFKKYDFNSMSCSDSEERFLSLLISCQDLQSILVNDIVSASKYAIASQKKESEAFLKDGLTGEERDALRDRSIFIKTINYDYSNGILSPKSVKKLTKIKRLEFINERNIKIKNKIESSKYGELYRTLNLSSEHVDAVTKKKIFNFCINEVEKLFLKDPSLIDQYGDINSVVSKMKKRALKLATMSVIRERVH